MRFAPPVEHHDIASGRDLTTWGTLRRGVQLSPELGRGIGVTVLLAFLATVGRVLVPFVVQRVTDEGILAAGGPDVDVVVRFIALALGGVVVTAFSAYFVNVRLFRSSESGLATLRLKAFRHIHDLSMLTQNTERRGSLVSRVTSDVDTISMFVQFGGLMLMINVAQITLATVLMLVYSPVLGLVVWVCFVPLFLIIRTFQGIVGRSYTKVRERVGDMLGAISEAVVGAQAIRAYGVEDRTAARIDTAIENHRKAAIGAQARAVMAFTSGQLVSGLTTAVVLVVGTVLAANGRLTLGELLAFLFLVNLFTMPVQQATEILNELQNAVAGWRRVIGIIDTPADVADPVDGVTLPRGPISVRFDGVGFTDPGEDGVTSPRGPANVRLEGVRFAYPDGPEVLHGVDLDLPARASVAVV
ncbi:MAG TPA: ABC transporter transmembrane domain-containing protein, partial [Intrasporangium sp.]|nr:ABC transporter transmembrane domain-containing protein [Intrasporangium sp.]